MEDANDIYGDIVSGGFGGDECLSRSNGRARVYDGGSWYITVRLSDICGAEIIEREDEDRCEVRRGIFIPFREGGLTVTSRKNVLAVFRADLAQVASPKYTHLLTQVAGTEAVSERRRLGYRSGYVGHMRGCDRKKTY